MSKKRRKKDEPLISHTGIELTRNTTWRFQLDPNAEQNNTLFQHAGARRWSANHLLGRVKTNLEQRDA